MTQQEIYQNMTKGEWKIEVCKHDETYFKFAVYTGTEREPDWVAECLMYNTKLKPEVKQTANINGIVSAMNNTYGKGINPESVEKMRDALEKLLVEYNKYVLGKSAALTEAKEALTAAKL